MATKWSHWKRKNIFTFHLKREQYSVFHVLTLWSWWWSFAFSGDLYQVRQSKVNLYALMDKAACCLLPYTESSQGRRSKKTNEIGTLFQTLGKTLVCLFVPPKKISESRSICMFWWIMLVAFHLLACLFVLDKACQWQGQSLYSDRDTMEAGALSCLVD